MICLNNFVIMGTAKGTNRDLNVVIRVLESRNLKVRVEKFNSIKVAIGFQKEECVTNTKNAFILFNGIFLSEEPSFISIKIIDDREAFLKEYRYQGTFAVIDRVNNSIYVVGDPGATRTVFYLITPGSFVIATDMELLKNVVSSLGFHLEFDVIALYEIVMLNRIVSRRTQYKNIGRLLPGEYIDIRLGDSSFSYRINRYWDVMQSDKKPYGIKEPIASLVKTLILLFNVYCKETQGSLVVPISGGIDSSLLLFLASKTENCKHLRAIHVKPR